MMGLLWILAVGVLVWAAMTYGGRMPASARTPVAAAIMFGLTGYVLFGVPGAAGAPVARPNATDSAEFGQPITDPRQGMTERFGPASQWLALSDGLVRTGRTQSAISAIEQGLRTNQGNIDLWIGMGNALVAHGGGVMTPAAALAFDKAADIDPSHPGPPFFAGLSLAQGGDLAGARIVWQELLDRSPADAPWREDLTERLSQLPPSPEQAPATASDAVAQ